MTHNLTHLSIIVYEYIKNYNDIHNARVVYKELCKNIKSYIVVEFCSIMRILQKLFIGGFTDEEGEVFTNKYLTAGVRQ